MTYPRDMSAPSISMMCPAIKVESSTSFKASSLLQVAAKPSTTTSKLAQGYKDLKSQELGSPIASCWQE
jgi:hypothetical protein